MIQSASPDGSGRSPAAEAHRAAVLVTILSSAGFLSAVSLAVCHAMHTRSFEEQKGPLVAYGGFVLLAAFAALFAPLRYVVASVVLLPFSLYVFGEFCGDVGRVHYLEAAPMALGMELLLLIVPCRILWRGVKVFRRAHIAAIRE